jgi:Asp-tRNA(Asn)/Glu-tRNA(Gln) amidotransferase A subunit family amidase
MQDYFDAFFKDFDAIIAPSAFGEAPEFGKAAGRSGFSTMWALAGLPCLSLPMLQGASGLPAGVQLIGSAELDDRLLRTASWLETHLAAID